MKQNNNLFQIALLLIFGISAFIGFLFFSTYESKKKSDEVEEVGSVEIWGTLPKETMNFLLRKLLDHSDAYSGIVYKQKESETFKIDFLEAIAEGNSPDLILVSQKNLFDNINKIYTIPFSTISSRYFKDTYLDAFSIFNSKEGIYGIPFMIDPMVMYYNKTIFNSEAIALPPKEWKDFINLSTKLTKKDTNDNILRSTISFGEIVNVTHYKEIISTLFFQSGNNITQYNDKNKLETIDFTQKEKNPSSSLVFFNEFSNPLSKIYSWNRTLSDSKKYFISGNLATYFGFVSEIKNIRKKNPNLNFDVAEIPKTSGTFDKTVFANVWALAISKNSKNKKGAFNTANILSSQKIQKILTKQEYLPSVRKDLANEPTSDDFMDIFQKEAVYAKTWIDPDYNATSKIFNYMIESSKSGSLTPTEAIRNSYSEIDYLFKK